MKRVKYISWNYGRFDPWTMLHLVRFIDGSAIVRTRSELIKLGIVRGTIVRNR
jgi:hypothetical protein